jgi:hypothetical protein
LTTSGCVHPAKRIFYLEQVHFIPPNRADGITNPVHTSEQNTGMGEHGATWPSLEPRRACRCCYFLYSSRVFCKRIECTVVGLESSSLQDLKGISPVLCTHRIPTDPDITPSRESQHRLNNAIREVVKKNVLKLLHVGIIYPIPHSEWVSHVQVILKKGGMTVVKNKKNELIPQRIVTG